MVIAIIGLLASVVLASLAEARERAQNAATISAIRSYITALEIYRNEHGGYPKVDNYNCLGQLPEGSSYCWKSLATHENLKTKLKPYIQSWKSPNPQKTDSASSPGSAYYTRPEGSIYTSDQKCVSGTCTEAEIYWTLENYEDDCTVSGAIKKPSTESTDYWCRLDLK